MRSEGSDGRRGSCGCQEPPAGSGSEDLGSSPRHASKASISLLCKMGIMHAPHSITAGLQPDRRCGVSLKTTLLSNRKYHRSCGCNLVIIRT